MCMYTGLFAVFFYLTWPGEMAWPISMKFGRKGRLSSSALETRSSATAQIVHVSSHYAIQDHSRKLILVPVESPYAIPVSE